MINGVAGPRPAPRPWWPATLVAVSGVLSACGHLAPELAMASWAGVAVLAWGLSLGGPAVPLGLGLFAAGTLHMWVGFPWQAAAVQQYVPEHPVAAALVFTVLFVLPLRAPTLLAWLFLRRWPVVAWLPVAVALGEEAHGALSGMTFNALLCSQWRVGPVLRALAAWGWIPTLLLGVACAAGLGEAWARRRAWPALVSAGGVLVFAVSPPLPSSKRAALADVGVVHMKDYARRPCPIPDALRLVVWPEETRASRPRLEEGTPSGVQVEPPCAGGTAEHIYGTFTRVPRGLQNSLLVLQPDGTVVQARAKEGLFPLFETPLLGVQLGTEPPLVPGHAPPVLHAAGRTVLALVCSEALHRRLAVPRETPDAQVMVIASSDRVLAGVPLAMDHLLAVAVLRAVETGLPVARASLHGRAALIDADGSVLAESAAGTTGILTLSRDVLDLR